MYTLFQYIFQLQVNAKSRVKLIYHLAPLHHADFYSVSQPNTICKFKSSNNKKKKTPLSLQNKLILCKKGKLLLPALTSPFPTLTF